MVATITSIALAIFPVLRANQCMFEICLTEQAEDIEVMVQENIISLRYTVSHSTVFSLHLSSSLLMEHKPGAEAHISPPWPVHGNILCCPPALPSHLVPFFLCRSPPILFRSSALSFALWCPRHCYLCVILTSFSQHVPYVSPSPDLNALFDRLCVCSFS